MIRFSLFFIFYSFYDRNFLKKVDFSVYTCYNISSSTIIINTGCIFRRGER